MFIELYSIHQIYSFHTHKVKTKETLIFMELINENQSFPNKNLNSKMKPNATFATVLNVTT